MKLFMMILGCRPSNRNTEQHDIFFGIAGSMADLIPDILKFWPEANGKIHVDAWREINNVDGYKIEILEKPREIAPEENKLFFINLGGYKHGEFDEFHYKLLLVANDMAAAIKNSKQTAFYKHVGFDSAPSHIDDKYGVDVDDAYEIRDILPKHYSEKFSLKITAGASLPEDEMHLGYFTMEKLRGKN